MKWLVYLVIAGLVATAGLMAFVRLAPTAVADWHVDPETMALPTTERYVALRGEEAHQVPVAPAAAAAAFHDAAMRAPNAALIAGDAPSGFMTFRHRTALMGFPDFLTVKVVADPDGAGARLHIVSRARFGRRDFGVNAERVSAILHDMDHDLGLDHDHGSGSDHSH